MAEVRNNKNKRSIRDGIAATPTPLHWGDGAWDAIIDAHLSTLEAELAKRVRGGSIFRRAVQCWKAGSPIGSNTEVAAALSWKVDEVAEGFRLVRRFLESVHHPNLDVRLRGYTRDLVVYLKQAVSGPLELVVSVPRDNDDCLGALLAGVRRAAARHSLRVLTEQPASAEEEARLVTEAAGQRYLILPCEDNDDFGLFGRLAVQRSVLLDIDVPGSEIPCATFDYVGIGLQCTNELLDRGCREIILLASTIDSRVREIAAGYRRSMRKQGLEARAILCVAPEEYIGLERAVEERIGLLQEAGVLNGRTGLICVGGALGAEVLRQLDGRDADGLNVSIAVVGGKPWMARHWTEPYWAELDYEQLGEKAASFLLQENDGPLPRVAPRYRKGPGRTMPRTALGVIAS